MDHIKEETMGTQITILGIEDPSEGDCITAGPHRLHCGNGGSGKYHGEK
jgi:hypothetical protein